MQEKKNTLKRIHNQLYTVEEKISEFEDSAIETTKNEREKNFLNRPSGSCEIINTPDNLIFQQLKPLGRERQTIFENQQTNIFPNLLITVKPHI